MTKKIRGIRTSMFVLKALVISGLLTSFMGFIACFVANSFESYQWICVSAIGWFIAFGLLFEDSFFRKNK